MKYYKELLFQSLIILTAFGLSFVAYDLSMPSAMSAFKVNFHRIAAPDQDFNFYMNILIPFILYMLSAGGLSYLILENVRMYRTTHTLRFLSRVIWMLWIFVLVLSAFLPFILGFNLLFRGIWYVFVAILLIISVIWLRPLSNKKRC